MRTIDVVKEQQKTKKNANVAFCVDALKGLSAPQKSLSSKYLYDDEGSRLFQEITSLEEYYPTACEKEIFEEQAEDIVKRMPKGALSVAELGAGDGHKTKLLLNKLGEREEPIEFYPIDISSGALRQLERNIGGTEKLKVEGIVGEYLAGLAFAKKKTNGPLVALFLGSNIGNFFPQARADFLSELRSKLSEGDQLLVGFDLKKDVDVLNRAYNDSEGVTARFNLNLLERMNRELGADFDTSKFAHHAFYNPVLGAMESYLLSLEEQKAHIKEFGKTFHFDAYESIHLEYSFKFTMKQIESMAHEAGFQVVKHFFDRKERYVDSLWEAKRPFGFYH